MVRLKAYKCADFKILALARGAREANFSLLGTVPIQIFDRYTPQIPRDHHWAPRSGALPQILALGRLCEDQDFSAWPPFRLKC